MFNKFKKLGKLFEANFNQHAGKYFVFGTILLPSGTYLIGRYFSKEEEEKLQEQTKIKMLIEGFKNLAESQNKVDTKTDKLLKLKTNEILDNNKKLSVFKKFTTDSNEYKKLLDCLDDNVDTKDFHSCIDNDNLYIKLAGDNIEIGVTYES